MGISQQICWLQESFTSRFSGYIKTPVMAHRGFLEKLLTYS